MGYCNECRKVPCCCTPRRIVIDPCPVGYNEVITDPSATVQYSEQCDPSAELSNKLYISNYVPFNMPACGEVADVVFHEADRVAPGAVVFAAGVGYLSVEAVLDEITLRLKNNCPTCGGEALNGKGPGEAIAALTLFTVGNPFCSFGYGSSVAGGGPYLDADFVIPASGSCALAKVTTISGLSIGDTVSIDSKEFRIGGIPDGTTLQLCNDGDGGTANTTINHDPDNDNVPNFPVLRLQGQNPCTTTAVSTLKRIVGCNGAGQEVGAVGTVDGHILSWDNDTEAFGLTVLPRERACVTTVTELTLDPSAPVGQTYIVEVDNVQPILDLVPFISSNDLLKLDLNDGNSMFFHSVVSGNVIRLQVAHGVTLIENYPIGSTLCVWEFFNQCTPNVFVSGPITGSINPKEFAVVLDNSGVPIEIVTAANSVSVTTIPVGIGSAGLGLGAGDGIWTLEYGPDQFGCAKFIEVVTNFECSMVMPDGGVAANVEFRVVKTLPAFDTQSYASHTFYGGFPLISPAIAPNLLVGGNGGAYYSINTFKGFTKERDYLPGGANSKYQGHVRIVVQNTTGGAKTVSFSGAWRGFRKASTYLIH